MWHHFFIYRTMVEELNRVPEQQTGVESNVEEAKNFTSIQEAKAFYKTVKQRLLLVNNWQQYAGAATAAFTLCNAEGTEISRLPQVGDHFKIDIPGPGPLTGDGYDWVQIEAVEEVENEEGDTITIRVRPATNPTNNRNDVAHFFAKAATSNFIAQRKGTTVTAAVLGRNEKPNVATETIIDKARNAAIATGAVSAFAKLQWKNLVKGLLQNE